MYKPKPNYKMKTLNSLFVLIIALSSLMATAQKADSVIVIYDNQKTVIPVPAFGSQTTIKMADSIQIIEIGVLRRRAGENFSGTVYSKDQFTPDINSEKGRKQVKWFSQIEAGYTKCFTAVSGGGSSIYTNQYGTPVKMVYDINMGDLAGYQLRALLRENVTMLRERFSFNSGFKIGYAQSFGNAFTNTSVFDTTTGNMLSDTSHFYDFRSNSFQLAYEVGFAYHFKTFKLPSKIVFGNIFSYSITGLKDVNDDLRTSSFVTTISSLIHPYIGAEIGKFGFLISMDFGNPTHSRYFYYPEYPINSGYNLIFTTGLTFRLF